MIELFVMVTVSFLTGIGGMYLASKTILKQDKILDISEDVIKNAFDMLFKDVEMQKQVYSVGVLFGNGLKTGLGLQKTGGKHKMEDLVQQGIGAFLSNIVGRIGQRSQSTQSTEPKLGEGFKT